MLASEIRRGNILRYMGDLYRVTDTQHAKPGKGGAFMQCEMQSLRTGKQKPVKFSVSDKVDKVDIFEKEASFSYEANSILYFMSMETMELIEYNKENLPNADFLVEGMEVKLQYAEDDLICILLPEKFTYEILDAASYIKGQSESSQQKIAKIQNNISIKVPQFVVEKDKIEVRIADSTYLNRI